LRELYALPASGTVKWGANRAGQPPDLCMPESKK
jgi:hypothetical protein